MAQERRLVNTSYTVKTHHELSQISEKELPQNAAQVLRDADQGIQTAILGADGQTVKSVVGLNGCRYLPDPDPDPLEEIIERALDAARGEHR